MYETIMQETTGVKIFQEEEKFLNAMECGQFYEKMDAFAMRLQGERNMSNSQICEIYFDSPFLEEKKEQFLITIEKKGNNKDFILKRRNQAGSYISEKTTRLSKKQYALILKGSIDWMKDSGKLLVNEFYYKIKVLEYQIAAVITCIRQEIYLVKEQMQVTVDRSIQKLFGENELVLIRENNYQLAHVKVRCAKEKQPSHPLLKGEWFQ